MGIYLCGYSESSVPTATRYEKIRGSNHSVGHLGSYSKGIMSTFPTIHWQGRETDHSLPSGADILNVWSNNSTPPYACTVCRRRKCTLLLLSL